MGKKNWSRSILVVSLLVTLSNFNQAKAANDPVIAAPVKLAWDASPDPAVAGYALYYRTIDSSANIRLDVGPSLAITLLDLQAGCNYIFFVVACDSAGVESPPSNEISYIPPALSRLQITEQDDGTMSIRFRAAVGARCRVEYASTPASAQWRTLGTANADADGNVVINDPPFGRPAVRFYRAVRLCRFPADRGNAVRASAGDGWRDLKELRSPVHPPADSEKELLPNRKVRRSP